MPRQTENAESRDIEAVLERLLPAEDTTPAWLHKAMRYAVLGGGKRIRMHLVYATGAALAIESGALDSAAAAAEFIHAYSLIHDDLPAMDDDALRRGRATVHVAFDEATAILAGDALQTLAFEVLAADPRLRARADIRIALVSTLTAACGSRGMVGGQALDMASEGRNIEQTALEQIHARKTGALLRAGVMMAAAHMPDLATERRDALDLFARRIGLAFQVRDDVLDIESDTATLGKTQGADIAHDKATYPTLLGVAGARDYAERLYREALDALTPFGERAGPLRALAAQIVRRDH